MVESLKSMLEGGTKEKERFPLGEVSSGAVEFRGGKKSEVNEIQTIMVNLTERAERSTSHLRHYVAMGGGRWERESTRLKNDRDVGAARYRATGESSAI